MAAKDDAQPAGPEQELMSGQETGGRLRTPRELPPAAQRALAEAAARRAEIDRRAAALPNEQNGRKGPEPVRYGDWEIKGLASDF